MGSGSKVLCLLAVCHLAAASRQLFVRVSPDNPPVTVNFSGPPSESMYTPPGYIPDLSMRQLAPADLGVDPEQVHVTHWAPGSLVFSWITGSALVGPKVTLPPVDSVGSWVMYGPASGQYSDTRYGANNTAYLQIYKNASLGEISYASPIIHHVLVTGLEPGETIFYRVGDPAYFAWSEEFSVTALPLPTVDNLPLRIGQLDICCFGLGQHQRLSNPV